LRTAVSALGLLLGLTGAIALLVFPTAGVALAAVALVLGLFSLRGATGGERVLPVMTVFVALGVLVAFGLLARGGTKSGGEPVLPL
jgi:hypothetical protein